MQFLASLPILLTCSFVLVLAYLLSIIFSYFASSVIHGNSSKARRQRSTHAPRPRSRRPPALNETTPDQRPEKAVMDRLQEEDEQVDEDAYTDATPATFTLAPRSYEFADSIFDDGSMREGKIIRREDYSRQGGDGIAEEDMQGRDELKQVGAVGRRWRDVDLGAINGELIDEAGAGEGISYGDAEYKQSENELRWDIKKELASMNGSSSKLGDAQGSSSPQQRLPPTWSDLQRMVNMNSKKDLLAPAGPPLDE